VKDRVAMFSKQDVLNHDLLILIPEYSSGQVKVIQFGH
jgi:hypothetical protein